LNVVCPEQGSNLHAGLCRHRVLSPARLPRFRHRGVTYLPPPRCSGVGLPAARIERAPLALQASARTTYAKLASPSLTPQEGIEPSAFRWTGGHHHQVISGASSWATRRSRTGTCGFTAHRAHRYTSAAMLCRDGWSRTAVSRLSSGCSSVEPRPRPVWVAGFEPAISCIRRRRGSRSATPRNDVP
jgi:hypothetical protein